jgi:TupA-like ATPgrasp
VFDGVPRLIALNHDRFTNFSLRYYTPDWEPLPHRSVAPLAEVQRRPTELPLLLEIAHRLGQPFDFMRVDLYLDAGAVWFGELTPYSAGGLQTYNPPDLDATLGGFWQLPKLVR